MDSQIQRTKFRLHTKKKYIQQYWNFNMINPLKSSAASGLNPHVHPLLLLLWKLWRNVKRWRVKKKELSSNHLNYLHKFHHKWEGRLSFSSCVSSEQNIPDEWNQSGGRNSPQELGWCFRMEINVEVSIGSTLCCCCCHGKLRRKRPFKSENRNLKKRAWDFPQRKSGVPCFSSQLRGSDIIMVQKSNKQ